MQSDFEAQLPDCDWYNRRLERARARDGLCGHLPPRRRQVTSSTPVTVPITPPEHEHRQAQQMLERSPTLDPTPTTAPLSSTLTSGPVQLEALTDPSREQHQSTPTVEDDKIVGKIPAVLHTRYQTNFLSVSSGSIILDITRAMLLISLAIVVNYTLIEPYRARFYQLSGADAKRDLDKILVVGQDIRRLALQLPQPVPTLYGWSNVDAMQLVLEDQLNHTFTIVDRHNSQLVSGSLPELLRSYAARKCDDLLQEIRDIEKHIDKIVKAFEGLQFATNVILDHAQVVQSQLQDSLLSANTKHAEYLNDADSTLPDNVLNPIFLVRANTQAWRDDIRQYSEPISEIDRATASQLRQLQEWQDGFWNLTDVIRNHTSTNTDDCKMPSITVLNDLCIGADGFKSFWPSVQAQQKFVIYYRYLRTQHGGAGNESVAETLVSKGTDHSQQALNSEQSCGVTMCLAQASSPPQLSD